MKYRTPHRDSFCAFALVMLISSPLFAQTRDSSGSKRIPREDIGIVKSLTVMPYATISYNLQSGQAFPKGAQGLGYGFGLAFDLTEEKQPVGAYFDFAYQDMRAHATDGTCARTSYTDTVSQSLPVTHYFSYALFEGFVKLQSPKNNGYFLIGASAGIATTDLTVREGAIAEEKYTEWRTVETFHTLRIDIRAGLGIKLGYISGHQLVFEARFGYPVTNVIGDYHDFCNGSDAHGSWRVVTLQGNIGLRL
jgi:hypothetical protein